MARAPVYSIWILSLSLLAACTSQPREASGQDRAVFRPDTEIWRGR